jgi:polyketide biosynthesis acyl carrier protein
MTNDELFQLVVRHAKEVIPELASHIFQRNDRLAELGANSMDRAEILMLVLDSLSLKIPRVELFGPKNIGELVELLGRKLQVS